MSKPRSQKDIFHIPGEYWDNEKMRTAYKAGFRFATDGTDTVYGIRSDGAFIPGKLGAYKSFPESPLGVVEKTMEFLLDPARSDANVIIGALADECFFGAEDEEARVEILERFLAGKNSEYQPCAAGIKRFREHMGGLLPEETETVWTLEVTGIDKLASKESVADDIQHAIKTTFRGQFWANVKVEGIDKEER